MTTPSGRPATCPVLVGREVPLADLERVLKAASGGTGQIVLLSGEAGIGKSRVVDAVKARAESTGFVVLEGACTELDRPFPTHH